MNMYIKQMAAWFPQANAAAKMRGSGNSVVDMLNSKALELSPLDAARKKVSDLREELENFFDPKIEKLVEGYRLRAARCASSRDELGFQQGQLDQFRSVSDSYSSAQQQLTATRQRYQASVEAYGDLSCYEPDGAGPLSAEAAAQRDMAQSISDMEKSISDLDRQLTDLVDASNRRSAKNAGISLLTLQSRQGETDALFTRENFVEKTCEQVENQQEEVKQNSDALVDYCRRYGLTSYDFEQYINGKSQLNASYLSAQQDLLTLLHQQGEDDGSKINFHV